MTKLDLSNLDLIELPNSIGQVTQLQQLNLAGNRLNKLPKSISQLIHLQELRLDYNQLTVLPESICNLTQLKQLVLSYNQLKILPVTIGKLTQLQQLLLSHNQIDMLSKSIGKLAQLQQLELSRNQLTSLPESIGRINQLQKLNLYRNQLTSLPESIGTLRKLRKLSLANNQLAVLPDSIGKLTQLQQLDLSNNQLTVLPEFIGKLTQLQQLDLSNNQLSMLSETIGQLNQLQILYLQSNRLDALPDSIGKLTQLQQLHLSNNQLAELPKSLIKLKLLIMISLHGNDLLNLHPELIGPTWHEIVNNRVQPTNPKKILEYYFNVREDKQPLNEAKLILVGRGAVGKTSIVNRLVYNRFNENETKTDGINITEWNLNGIEDVRLNIWDFGGQEIMHDTHQFFLTHRSLYLLVLSGREGSEDDDAEYWLRLIKSFGGDSPIIVVLNKIKTHLFDLNRRALQEKYLTIRDFVRTDCIDGTGISELHKVIKRETDRLEHLRQPFPTRWFSIKNDLAKKNKDYITYDQYRKICEKHGEMDKEAQDNLAGYLHRLGIMQNYKDDPRLSDTYVINPHWVTNGIYKIINSDKLKKQKGQIRLSELSEILDRNKYPENRHAFLLDLMKKFNLCFNFPDDYCNYLIPKLLDIQQPQRANRFVAEKCLNFQYHYCILPEGLLSRFIVRTHVLSDHSLRWRTGVILKFEDCEALVKSDMQDRKVVISVSGPASNRRRLLAVIRSYFEEINHFIPSLEPKEVVPLPNYPNEIVPYKELLVMEQNEIKEFPKVIGNDIINLNVQELLCGVDIEGTIRRERKKPKTLSLFYCYSHKDESLRNELDTHLKLLQRQGLIEIWHDRKIEAGDDWKKQIDKNMEYANIILLLVSPDFIDSDYCYNIEMKYALERHAKKEARVIPVIVRDVNWKRAPFANLQALPENGKAVTLWENKDSAWRNVSEGIEKTLMSPL